MSRLIKGGVPLAKALGIADIPEKAAEMIMDGKAVSDSIEQYFSRDVIDLVRIGERTGELDTMFLKAAQILERKKEFRSKLTKALAYPLIVLSASLMTLIGFIVVGIPKMNEIFISFGMPPPRSLAVMSNISKMTPLIGIVIIFAISVLSFCTSKGMFRRELEFVKYNIPFFGKIAAKLETSMICRNISMLLRSGMPFLEALGHAEKSVKPVTYKSALQKVAEKISSGCTPSDAFRGEKCFDSDMTRILAAAQESACLEDVLEGSADILEEEAHENIKAATLLVEPLSTVLVGAVVGFVVIQMFSPMMKIMGSL